ncbi:hypothetical protein AOQ70_10945 [Bacillus sp. AM 13(2015)]|nr:hypothetical protein AOQ70_10945 [Bacillus sp. AM 13(2015)]
MYDGISQSPKTSVAIDYTLSIASIIPLTKIGKDGNKKIIFYDYEMNLIFFLLIDKEILDDFTR